MYIIFFIVRAGTNWFGKSSNEVCVVGILIAIQWDLEKEALALVKIQDWPKDIWLSFYSVQIPSV